MSEEIISINPHTDRIIGVIGNNIYLKSEYLQYIVITTEKEYFKTLKEYIETKRDFCNRYKHFCGVFGDIYAKKYERLSEDFKLNEVFDVKDDGTNDGIELREVSYPIYFVEEFEQDCDMEHG